MYFWKWTLVTSARVFARGEGNFLFGGELFPGSPFQCWENVFRFRIVDSRFKIAICLRYQCLFPKVMSQLSTGTIESETIDFQMCSIVPLSGMIEHNWAQNGNLQNFAKIDPSQNDPSMTMGSHTKMIDVQQKMFNKKCSTKNVQQKCSTKNVQQEMFNKKWCCLPGSTIPSEACTSVYMRRDVKRRDVKRRVVGDTSRDRGMQVVYMQLICQTN